MTIVATAPVPEQHRLDNADTDVLPAAGEPCPEWCTRHILDDEHVRMHMSQPAKVTVDRYGEFGVEVYRYDLRPGEEPGADVGETPAVYFEGGGQVAMTPAQALELARVLIEQAGRALGADTEDRHFPPGMAAKIYQLGRDAGLRASREDAYWRGYDAGMNAMAGCTFDEYGDIVRIDGAKPA